MRRLAMPDLPTIDVVLPASPDGQVLASPSGSPHVAQRVGIEINPDYCTICEARLAQDVLLLETSDSRPNREYPEQLST